MFKGVRALVLTLTKPGECSSDEVIPTDSSHSRNLKPETGWEDMEMRECAAIQVPIFIPRAVRGGVLNGRPKRGGDLGTPIQ